MIYCGYQGVGKSTYCRENPLTTVDLDSSNFTKNEGWFVDYIAMASELSNNGKKVFISAHQCVIEYLLSNNYEFEVLIPAEAKEVWRSRLEFRYSKVKSYANMKALFDFDLHYDSDMNYYNSLELKGVKVHRIKARIKTTLEDFLDK